MHELRLSLLLWTALLSLSATVPQSAQTTAHLRLSAVQFDGQKQGDLMTLWLRIENLSGQPMILCRPYWSYSFTSADPDGPVTGEATASIHGCGDRDHDPFWLVLPGESRFDSFEVKGLSEPDALLQVEVELVERRPRPGSEPTKSLISWSGRVADALAAGQQLQARAK